MEKILEVVPGGNEESKSTETALTPEERLIIQLAHTQRRSLEFEMVVRRMEIDRQMHDVAEAIRKRTGVDIRDGKHEVDLARGLCVEKQTE